MKMNKKNFLKNREKDEKIRFQREDLCDNCLKKGVKKVIESDGFMYMSDKQYFTDVFWASNEEAQNCETCLKNYYLHVKKRIYKNNKNKNKKGDKK